MKKPNRRIQLTIVCSVFLLLAAAAVFTVAGCTSNAYVQETAPPTAVVEKNLQSIISTGLTTTQTHGITIQVAAPTWTWNSAAGKAGINPDYSAEPGMRARIASISKTFTAAAVLKLVEDGALTLDDPITMWLPATITDRIQYADQITIRHLLQHRSGIKDYVEMDLVALQQSQPDVPVTTEYAIYQGVDAGPLWEPGGGYTYSNVNYLLLTLIIDAASNSTYEDYLRTRIFEPLALRDTLIPEGKTIPGSHMECLMGVNGAWVDYTDLYVKWDRGSGDIISSAPDLNTFHQALREGRVISPAMFAEMRTFLPVASSTPDILSRGYGMGYEQYDYFVSHVTLEGHSGGYPGSATMMYYWAEKDIYISYNVNDINIQVKTAFLDPIIEYLTAVE